MCVCVCVCVCVRERERERERERVFKAFMGFSYTFYKWFKPQYLLVLVKCAFMGFWYGFISFVLHPRLRLNLLKNKG